MIYLKYEGLKMDELMLFEMTDDLKKHRLIYSTDPDDIPDHDEFGTIPKESFVSWSEDYKISVLTQGEVFLEMI